MLLLLLPFGLAVDDGDISSGELMSDSFGSRWMCNVFLNIPKICSVYIESKSSGAVDGEDIGALLNVPSANAELNEAKVIQLRTDNAQDRLIALYDLFGVLFILMFQLLISFFTFLEIYLVLWVLFVGIPKLLNLFLKFIVDSRGVS